MTVNVSECQQILVQSRQSYETKIIYQPLVAFPTKFLPSLD